MRGHTKFKTKFKFRECSTPGLPCVLTARRLDGVCCAFKMYSLRDTKIPLPLSVRLAPKDALRAANPCTALQQYRHTGLLALVSYRYIPPENRDVLCVSAPLCSRETSTISQACVRNSSPHAHIMCTYLGCCNSTGCWKLSSLRSPLLFAFASHALASSRAPLPTGFPLKERLRTGKVANLPLSIGNLRRSVLLMPEGDDKDQMQVAESAGEFWGA